MICSKCRESAIVPYVEIATILKENKDLKFKIEQLNKIIKEEIEQTNEAKIRQCYYKKQLGTALSINENVYTWSELCNMVTKIKKSSLENNDMLGRLNNAVGEQHSYCTFDQVLSEVFKISFDNATYLHKINEISAIILE